MAPATSTKLTYEDYCLLPDDGRRHEIIDGEHYVNPAPHTKHQRISRKIAFAMATFVEPRRLREVFYAPYDVLLSGINIVEPDILYVSGARSHIITDANIQGAPDLVVEILSTGNRKYDEVVKFKLYDTLGRRRVLDRRPGPGDREDLSPIDNRIQAGADRRHRHHTDHSRLRAPAPGDLRLRVMTPPSSPLSPRQPHRRGERGSHHNPPSS
jgi:hypothetical protein